MQKPILVIMAAGPGSRIGGLKQIAPVDENGHLLIDYSIYDAIQAGFGKVDVQYAYQTIDRLPEGYSVPEGRSKATVTVLPTAEKWYGVTCAADMPKVQSALAAMRENGAYPEQLWR